MALYFLVLDSEVFHGHIRPALAASWRSRSFAPCRSYCARILPAAREFGDRYQLDGDEPLLAQIEKGLAFDRLLWHHLAGEFLWFSAAEIPEVETNERALAYILKRVEGWVPKPPPTLQEAVGWVEASEPTQETEGWGNMARAELPPIVQVHRGSRDLIFGGGFYRPENAGWSDVLDVLRLGAYLRAVQPENWQPADLAGLPDLPEDEREEELAFVRDWFPSLQALYEKASVARQVVVCETLE